MTDKHSIFKSVSITFIANITSILSSILITLLLPKFIDVSDYGYYQLYIFYIGYIAFLGFGWNDGVYLQLGGSFYNEIDKDLYSIQWRIFSFIEVIIGIIIIIIGFICFETDKKYVIMMVGLCVIIYLPRAFIHNIFQATFRIKEYAYGLIIEKIFQIIITVIFLFCKKASFTWYIAAALSGRFCSTLYIFYVGRDLIFYHVNYKLKIGKDIKKNITRGIKLMFANIASILIIGIVRQGVELKWDISTFGKISLSFSLANFFLIFIQSISTILFPLLRRIRNEKLSNIYLSLRTSLMFCVLFALFFYYPFRLAISHWLPNYSDSLKYLDILFPVFVFQSKFSMLVETYLKTLNKENKLLFINAISVLASLVCTYLTIFIFNNLLYALVGIIFILDLRCVLGEIIIKRIIGIKIWKNIFLETGLIIIFIKSNFFFKSWGSSICYIVFFFIYLLLMKTEIKATFSDIKSKLL